MLADQVNPEMLWDALKLAGYVQSKKSRPVGVSPNGRVHPVRGMEHLCTWQPRSVLVRPWEPGGCHRVGCDCGTAHTHV
jgi:hypothetical protein